MRLRRIWHLACNWLNLGFIAVDSFAVLRGKNYMNIHFHGVDLDPRIERPLLAIDGGGKSKLYEFVVPSDHPPGTNWYHNVFHGTSAYSMMSGLFGVVIVEGTPYDISQVPEIAAATEVPMILSETKVDSNGSVADYIKPFFDFGWKPLVNGQYRPVYNFSLGETVLFRAASASIFSVYYLSITPYANTTDASNITMIPVAEDGYPVNSIQEMDMYDLYAGSRIDLLVQFNQSGTFAFRRKR